MASDRSLIGKRYATCTLTLSAAQGAAFAAATDDPADYPAQDLLPPMAVVIASIPHGIMQVAADAQLIGDPARLARVVHGEEDIVWHAPLRPDTPWQLTPQLLDVQACSAGEALTVRTEVVGLGGACLAVATSLMLIRERTPGAPRRAAVPPPPALQPAHRIAWTVAADQPERYAAASGDHNAIHLDDAMARQVGLRGRILHGLCTMSFAARAVREATGCGPAGLRRLRLRFTRPVYPGDTLTCQLAAPTRGADGGDSALALEVVNGEGQRVAADGVGAVRSA